MLVLEEVVDGRGRRGAEGEDEVMGLVEDWKAGEDGEVESQGEGFRVGLLKDDK